MSGILTQLREIAEVLNTSEYQWALIGALAVSIYTEPRTTRDIDIAIILEEKDHEEELIQYLFGKGYHSRYVLQHAMPSQRLGNRVLTPADTHQQSIPIDLLSSSTGIEKEVVHSSQKIEVFPTVVMPVARVSHLIAMKVLSENSDDRMKDQLDLKNLLKIATTSDIDSAREAVQLIEERGFARRKDLLSTLEGYIT
jgi:predicted nucleotidyltransferase